MKAQLLSFISENNLHLFTYLSWLHKNVFFKYINTTEYPGYLELFQIQNNSRQFLKCVNSLPHHSKDKLYPFWLILTGGSNMMWVKSGCPI